METAVVCLPAHLRGYMGEDEKVGHEHRLDLEVPPDFHRICGHYGSYSVGVYVDDKFSRFGC